MKFIIYFILACSIGAGALLVAATVPNPWPAFAVGFGVWILFMAWVIRRGERTARKKERERLFDEWLRDQHSRRGR